MIDRVLAELTGIFERVGGWIKDSRGERKILSSGDYGMVGWTDGL